MSEFPPSTLASNVTAVSEFGPDEYERASYYNGITGDSDHPELVYRSDFRTTPFPKPVGRFAHVPVKSTRGVFGTPLNMVWDTVGPKIRDIVKAQKVRWSSIDPARFFTHGPLGEDEKGSLGPVVIWIGVLPGSTSPATAHDVSQQILDLLANNGVKDVVVEWREAVLQRLTGPALLSHASNKDPTHYVRRFLTPLHGVPLATEDMEHEDSQGTLTLWFHENKDINGNPSKNVYGVSNCHVLRKNTTIDYVHKGGAPRNHVRICGSRRFERALEEISKEIRHHTILAGASERAIIHLQQREEEAAESVKDEIQWRRRQLAEEKAAIIDLEDFRGAASRHWSNINLHRDIGYVRYAQAIKVDQGRTGYTTDWAAFLVTEDKVRKAFEGNVVDLGSKFTPGELGEMFYPTAGRLTTFKYPHDRKLRIMGCATKMELAAPTELDRQGQLCLVVGKDGNATDLTVGHYAGLESFAQNEVGVESIEVAIYNCGIKAVEPFSDKGDSGSLVWHMKDGQARIVGQIHSALNRGGLTSIHTTYCTPGWYLLDEIKKEFKYADFYRTTWSD